MDEIFACWQPGNINTCYIPACHIYCISLSVLPRCAPLVYIIGLCHQAMDFRVGVCCGQGQGSPSPIWVSEPYVLEFFLKI